MIPEDLATPDAPVDSSSDASTSGFDAGVAEADAKTQGRDSTKLLEDRALVQKWQNRIKQARAFDENVRKQYAINRRYLRGQTGFTVSVPLAPSYVSILCSISYAKNPDLDVQPAPSTSPPPMASIIEMAREQIINDPDTKQHMEMVGMEAEQTAAKAHAQAQQQAAASGVDPNTIPPLPEPGSIGEEAAQVWLNQKIKDTAHELMKPYRRALEDAKQFGKTMGVVVSDAWMHAKLKARAKKQLRSYYSHAIGWLKATWQDRVGNDPVQHIEHDEKQSLDSLAAMADKIDNTVADNADADRARLAAKHAGLDTAKVKLHRGLAIDFVPVQDVQIDTSTYSMEDYLEAGWIGHRFTMARSQGKIAFPDIADQLDKANPYYPKRPMDPKEIVDVGPIAQKSADANEAEQFVTNANFGSGGDAYSKDDPNIVGWEIWSKDDNVIYTIIEGVPDFARPPYPPNVPTTRFYPLFQLASEWIDGQREPEGLIKRTAQLLDEVNATHSDARTHRRRAIPKTVANGAQVPKEEMKKMEGAVINEIVVLDLPNPKADVGKLFKNFQYPPFDPKLYDDTKAKAELETAWGIQEALASSIQTAKTATEAEIQQTGTNARTGYRRDDIDEMLNDLAQYTAEILVQKYTHQEVIEIAGPWAFWPGPGADGAPGIELDAMHSLITIKIKAGSSGKPNTSAAQQAWAVTMPLLDQKISDIGQLRGSSPEDIADCKEELVSETLARAGEGLDSTRFIPQAPSKAPGERPDPTHQPMQGPQPVGRVPPHPMPATLPAPNGQALLVPHRGHITTHNRPPAALNQPGQT